MCDLACGRRRMKVPSFYVVDSPWWYLKGMQPARRVKRIHDRRNEICTDSGCQKTNTCFLHCSCNSCRHLVTCWPTWGSWCFHGPSRTSTWLTTPWEPWACAACCVCYQGRRMPWSIFNQMDATWPETCQSGRAALGIFVDILKLCWNLSSRHFLERLPFGLLVEPMSTTGTGTHPL